ncbi:MAG: hypothetical protein AAF415_20660 [Pseudomonadota bacterium]
MRLVSAPLVVSAAMPDDGRLLTPICAGGKIQYVLIDVTGELPPEVVDAASDSQTVVSEIDCPLMAGKSGVPPAQIALSRTIVLHTAPGSTIAEQSVRPSSVATRPPVRAPPRPN